MNYDHITIRTFISDIYDIRGNLLPINISFIISKKSIKTVDPKMETCLIFLDNGKDDLEEFIQHVVNKKLMYENSI